MVKTFVKILYVRKSFTGWILRCKAVHSKEWGDILISELPPSTTYLLVECPPIIPSENKTRYGYRNIRHAKVIKCFTDYEYDLFKRKKAEIRRLEKETGRKLSEERIFTEKEISEVKK